MPGLGIGPSAPCCNDCVTKLCWVFVPKCGDKVVSATYDGPTSGSFPQDDDDAAPYLNHFRTCIALAEGEYTVTVTVEGVDLSPCGGPDPETTTLTGTATVPACGTGVVDLGNSTTPDPVGWSRVGRCVGDCCWMPDELMVTFDGPVEVFGAYKGMPILMRLTTSSTLSDAQCTGVSQDVTYAPVSAMTASGAYVLCGALGSSYYGDNGVYNTYEYATICDRCSGITHIFTPWVKQDLAGCSASLTFRANCSVVASFGNVAPTESCAQLAPDACSGPPDHPTGDRFTGKVCKGPYIPWCDFGTSTFLGNIAPTPGFCAPAFCKCAVTPGPTNPLPDEIHPQSTLPLGITLDSMGPIGSLTGTLCPPDFIVGWTDASRGCQTCYTTTYPSYSVRVTLP